MKPTIQTTTSTPSYGGSYRMGLSFKRQLRTGSPRPRHGSGYRRIEGSHCSVVEHTFPCALDQIERAVVKRNPACALWP